MKRSLLVLIATLALVLGLSSSASGAANPVASCMGVTASSFAGTPGGEASDRGDGRDEAAEQGIPPGALFSDFARHHLGTVDACHEGTQLRQRIEGSAEALEAVGLREQAMSEENVELVRRLYEAVAGRDSDTVLSIYHPDLEWDHTHNIELAGLMGGQTIYHGHDGLRRWSREFYEAWENVDAELEELIDAGDQVVVVLNYRGHGRVSGIEVEITRMAGVLTIRDGQVTRAEWFRRRDEAIAAAGLREQARSAALDEKQRSLERH